LFRFNLEIRIKKWITNEFVKLEDFVLGLYFFVIVLLRAMAKDGSKPANFKVLRSGDPPKESDFKVEHRNSTVKNIFIIISTII